MITVSSTRPPVRVAVMGCGRVFHAEHLPVFSAHPALFQIVAACDLVKARRDPILKPFPKCKMFRRFGDMLDERDIDLVLLSSVTKDHLHQAFASLDRNYWTLVENPMAVTVEDAQKLRGASVKAGNRLLVLQRGMFESDYLLARSVMTDPRLGEIYDIRIRREDWIRRDDWQTVKRLGGGAAYYAMTDMILQALKLLPMPPMQMWSELKRVASLGDAEDFVHVNLRTRSPVTADLEYNGGCLEGLRSPSFEIRGERGAFRVEQGALEGVLHVVDPKYEFPRRRASVRTPPLRDLHEKFEIVDIPVRLPRGTMSGISYFWKCVYDTVRVAAPFPVPIEDSIEAIKFAQLMKKTSPYGSGK